MRAAGQDTLARGRAVNRRLPNALLAVAGGLVACRDAGFPPPEAAWFDDASRAAGVDDGWRRPVPADYFMPDSMGPGCALFDCDGDGDLDAYLVRGRRDPSGAPESELGANVLLLRGPDGRYERADPAGGAADRGYGMGVATGDIDNDGDVDLYVTNYGPDRLYRNKGDGTFEDATAAAGVATAGWSASAGFFDHDGDGFLDLFVVRYLEYDHAEAVKSRLVDFPGPQRFRGVPDVLYRNRGDGTFEDVSAETGIAALSGKGLGLAFCDLDGDGTTDVYVANDGEPNFAWVRGPDGGLREAALEMGLALNSYGSPEAGMGVACGDADGDGLFDLFVAHLVQETNTLYLQHSPGEFRDSTAGAGLGASSVDFTGFGVAFLDLELDGDLDLVGVNGRIRRGPEGGARGAAAAEPWRPYAEPSLLYLNDGEGRFALAGARCGPLCAEVGVGRGLALGDVDGDGDLDLLLSEGDGRARLLENVAPRSGRPLVVRARLARAGRDALGALVEVECGGRLLRRRITATDGYLSSSDPSAHFGLSGSPGAIRVRWPDGSLESFDPHPGAGARILVQGEGL